MNPIIKQALVCLENANYTGYFEELDKIPMPSILKNSYSTSKNDFIDGVRGFRFVQQLQVFAKSLDTQLIEENEVENPISNPIISKTPKKIENTTQTMNKTTNFTISDLHEQTYIFLFGTSKYAEDSGLTPMLNVEVNLTQLKELFINEQGVKEKNIRSFLNQTGDDIKHELCTFLEDISPKSTFIFYFAGHGVLGENQKLYFTTPKSRTKTIQGSGISASGIREIISDCRIDRKIIILDCCFSGDFTDKMASAEQAVLLQIKELSDKIKGSFVMTSSEQTKISMFDSKNPERPTYFTESIIQTLKEGIKGKKDFLTTLDIYENIKYLYTESKIDLPRPTRRADNEGDEIIFAINRNKHNQPKKTKVPPKTDYSEKENVIQNDTQPTNKIIMPEIDKAQLRADLSDDIDLFFEKMEKNLKNSPDKLNSLFLKRNNIKRLKKNFKDTLITEEAYNIGYTKVELYLFEMIDELN